MAKDVTKYNSKVGRLQGGDEFYMKTDGLFQFYDTELYGRELDLFFKSSLTFTQHASADLSSGSTLDPAYGYHVLSAATGMSTGSITMPTASKGATLIINGSYLVGDANISVNTDSTVGLVVNTRGSDLSSFEISAAGQLKAVCATDGTWQIAEQNITEHASS
jgi:hypothetical protein